MLATTGSSYIPAVTIALPLCIHPLAEGGFQRALGYSRAIFIASLTCVRAYKKDTHCQEEYIDTKIYICASAGSSNVNIM